MKDLKEWVKFALFAAVTAVCSQISIPLAPVPINLGTFAVIVTGVLCSTKIKFGGAVSILIYILLGAVGLPVFAGFRGGIGVLAGPTGGYIFGYIVMTLIYGYLYGTKKLQNILVLILGNVLLYICGTIWFIILTGNGLIPALMMCVVPFLIGDALKIAAAYIIITKLRWNFNGKHRN